MTRSVQATPGFSLQFQDVRLDFIEWSQGLVLVKILGEVDFIADLVFVSIHPGIGDMGQDLLREPQIRGHLTDLPIYSLVF